MTRASKTQVNQASLPRPLGPVLASVLDRFDIPPLETQVPLAFRQRFGLVAPQQYGIAVADVAVACRAAEELGAGPFLQGRIPATGWTEAGEPRPRCQLEVGLGYASGVQVEFLGPGRGTDFYSAALKGRAACLHHAGFYQPGVEAIGRALVAAGHPEAVRGGVVMPRGPAFDYRYYDTREALGIYTEVLDFSFRLAERRALPLRIDPLLHAAAAVKRVLRRLRPLT